MGLQGERGEGQPGFPTEVRVIPDFDGFSDDDFRIAFSAGNGCVGTRARGNDGDVHSSWGDFGTTRQNEIWPFTGASD